MVYLAANSFLLADNSFAIASSISCLFIFNPSALSRSYSPKFLIIETKRKGDDDVATKQTSLPGMGFNGIAVAFLGCLNPIGALFASLFITHINVGGGYLDTTYYTSEIANLISSIIIYLCAFSLFIKMVITKIQKNKEAKKDGGK